MPYLYILILSANIFLHQNFPTNAPNQRVYIEIGTVPIRQTGAFPIRKLDYVDIFKIKKYIMENTFKVEKLDAVNREITELTQEQRVKRRQRIKSNLQNND